MMSPSFIIDLTTASLPPSVSFARALGTATRINSSGFIESVSADVARFDFNPVTLACRGLLIEESRSNLLRQSNAFSTSPWLNTRASSVVSSVVGPDGVANAFKLTEDSSASTTHVIAQDTTNGNATYTFSVYLKAGERTRAAVWMSDLATAAVGIRVNLSDGTFTITTGGSWTNISGSVTDAGNGWWRCVTTAIRGAGTGTSPRVLLADSAGNTTYSGNGTSGLYIWGAQLEAGASATSYIPTTTTALTRNADVATITGTNFSSFWQSTRGGVLVRARPGTVSGTRPWVQFDDGTADNSIALRGNTTNPELYIRAGGADQATIDAGTIAANTSYRLAGTWNTNDCAANLNGAAPVLDTSATIPAVTQMRLGSDGTNYLNGHIEAVEYYDQRIMNSALQVAGSPAGYRSVIQPLINRVL